MRLRAAGTERLLHAGARGGRHVSQRREVPQPAETLRQDQQRQEVLIGPGHAPRPRHLAGLRRVEHMQLPRRWQPFEPRIRRPLDRGHPRRPPYDPTRSATQIDISHTDRRTYQAPQPGKRSEPTLTTDAPSTSQNTRSWRVSGLPWPHPPLSVLLITARRTKKSVTARPLWLPMGPGRIRPERSGST
jgi:hypothetical protein